MFNDQYSMLNVQLKKSNAAFILLFQILILFILSSCSVHKRISKSAKEEVLNIPTLQTAHAGISIYEPATGKYWYDYNGEKYFVPASNVKIPTCYAAMKYLGDSLVGLRYEDGAGGFVYGFPTGDPTFLHPDFNNQPVFDFIKKNNLKGLIWSQRDFKSSFYGNGWSWNDYQESYMPERSPFPVYGNIVTIKDTGNTIPKVYINRATFGGAYPKGYRVERSLSGVFTAVDADREFSETKIPFVTDPIFVSGIISKAIGKDVFTNAAFIDSIIPTKLIHSQPTDSVLKPMMHRSDNFFAEQLLLMVSNERLGVMNDEKIIDTLLKTDFKDLPQKPRWVDGSGLSRYNLFTPQDFVVILNKLQNEFGMARIKNIFPTVGEGTLTNYYTEDSNYIYAKTGSLSGVVALSGYLTTKKGKQLIFSVLVNNHQTSGTEVRRAVEKFLQGVRDKY